MIHIAENMKKLIRTFIVLCFLGLLSTNSAFSEDAAINTFVVKQENTKIETNNTENITRTSPAPIEENILGLSLEETRREEPLVRLTGFNSINNKWGTGYKSIKQVVQTKINNVDTPVVPDAATTGGSADSSWLNRTVLLNNIYDAKVGLYLAQGQVANNVSDWTTSNTSDKKNKWWDGLNTGWPASNTRWWTEESVLSRRQLLTFTDYSNSTKSGVKLYNITGVTSSGVTGTLQKSSGNNSALLADCYNQWNGTANKPSIGSDGCKFINVRMRIRSLTPYLVVTNLNSARAGYSPQVDTEPADFYNVGTYSSKSDYSSYTGGTEATTNLFLDEDKDAAILYLGAASNIGTFNMKWYRHVYTFKLDYDGGHYSGNLLATYGTEDVKALTTFSSTAKVTDQIPMKIGYKFQGYYTNSGNSGSRVITEEGKPDTSNNSYWNSSRKLIKTAKPKNMDYISKGLDLNSNEHNAGCSKTNCTCPYVYVFDENGNKTECPLYAHWNPITYNVTYDYNGGNEVPSNPTSCKYDTAYPITATTRTGYTFTGWTVENGIVTSLAANTNEIKNLSAIVTLTAQWTPNPYKVTFHANYPNGTDDTSNQWIITYDSNGYIDSTAPKYSYDNYHIVGYKYADSDTRLYDWNGDVPNPTLYKTAANTWWDSYGQYKNACDIDV